RRAPPGERGNERPGHHGSVYIRFPKHWMKTLLLRRDTERGRQDARVGPAGLAAADGDPGDAAFGQLARLEDKLQGPVFAHPQREPAEAFKGPHTAVLDVKLHHLLAVQFPGV